MATSWPCDSHVHVFDPERYPYAPVRRFTPERADVAQLRRCLDQAGMARVVLVQPSVYGTDNRCLLDAMAQLGPRARGVAVVASDTSVQALTQLSDAGVVGARCNQVVNRSQAPTDTLQAVQALQALLPGDWHIQLHVSLQVLAQLAPLIRRSRRRFVLDHLGLPQVEQGPDAPLWQQMLALVQEGRLCVKLSGPYLSSQTGAPYADLRPFVESLMQANPQALLWGSNWPHTQGLHRPQAVDLSRVESFRQEDARVWPEACARWLGPALYDGLHSHAQQVYGFPEEVLSAGV